MKQNNNPQNKAQELLDKFGLDDIIDIPMSDFVSGIDLIYMEEPLKNCDGKIIFGDKKTIIIIRKSKFPQNPKRSVQFSGKGTKRSVQKRKARNTQKAETKVL